MVVVPLSIDSPEVELVMILTPFVKIKLLPVKVLAVIPCGK